jgi:hypothetical protein
MTELSIPVTTVQPRDVLLLPDGDGRIARWAVQSVVIGVRGVTILTDHLSYSFASGAIVRVER